MYVCMYVFMFRPTRDQTLGQFSIITGEYKNVNCDKFLLSYDLSNITIQLYQHEFQPMIGPDGKVVKHQYDHESYLADGKIEMDEGEFVQKYDGLYGIVSGKILASNLPTY